VYSGFCYAQIMLTQELDETDDDEAIIVCFVATGLYAHGVGNGFGADE
jgi:hypothetical protein